MRPWTRGGCFYLPYRLHAERAQVARAYSRLDEFGARKRHYDPGLLFQQHHVGPVLRMNPLRILAVVYAVLFAGVTSLNYIPGLTDAQGRTFGLFALDVFDDALHAASGVWAALAAWTSFRATRIFFCVFGPLYCLDGLLGLATGSGYLDLGIVVNGVLELPLTTRDPHEPAAHRDRRFRRLRRIRAGAPLGASRRDSALTCSAGRCGSSADCSCSR